VNSPETPIFRKGQVLYGLDKTKRALLDTRQAIVCEGQLDMIACFEAGIANVVASQGTAFTERHGRLLKRYVDEVVLMFDSDTAGQNAASRSVDALLEAGLVVRVATVPQGHDPDSLVRKEGAEAIRRVVESAQTFLDFYLDFLCRRNDPQSDTGRGEITRLMAEMLAKIPNPATSYPYVTKTARRLQLPETVVNAEVRKALRSPGRATEEDSGIGVESYLSSSKKVTTAERELLHLMLTDASIVALVQQQLSIESLPSGPYKTLIVKILALAQTAQWRGPESLQDELTDADIAGLLSELLLVEPRHRDRRAAALEYVNALHQEAVIAERELIQERLADPKLSADEMVVLQKRLTELRQKPVDLKGQDKHITRLSHR
jgi:DNA primase